MDHEVDVHAFAAAHGEGAFVIDVREPLEYVAGHVPGARLVPLGALHREAASLPVDRTVYVICASGNRSLMAARWLAARGLEALSVAGGTIAWSAGGRPVLMGAAEGAA